MGEVKWIKIVTDIFDDEKVLLIESLPEADSIIVIWFKLLCLAGKNNNSGVFMMSNKIPYTDEMLATIFRRKLNVVKLALKTFEQFGMIEIIDNVITIPNWSKHQTLDQLENKKEYMKEYMKGYREKQKMIASNTEEKRKTNSKTNSKANVSSLDKEEDIELDKDIINNTNVQKKFIKPVIEDIRQYCLERNNNIDPEQFYDFYESKGWLIGGKAKMKDWKAAVRTWEKNKNIIGNNSNNLKKEVRKVPDWYNNYEKQLNQNYTSRDIESSDEELITLANGLFK